MSGMAGRKTDTEECEGCGSAVTGDPGQCPECGMFLNRGRLVRWFVAAVAALGVVTYLVLGA